MTRNAELAGATLGHLIALGVRDFVVCAGARNAPLVTSLLAASESKGLRVWHHFDERTASFFGLGLARSRDEPVVVLTTSGTAAAELLPAAIEGYYEGVPLILVTADRPEWYRGSGAPQSIEQKGLYGIYAPLAIDVQRRGDLSWVVKWDRKAPLHLNVCFEEPAPNDCLVDFRTVVVPEPARRIPGQDEVDRLERFVSSRQRMVVIVGALPKSWRESVELFLNELGAPVWAEAISGLRESEVLAPQLIRQEHQVGVIRPDSVLRIGGIPSLRYWRDLETLRGIEVLSVTRQPFPGLGRDSELLLCDQFPLTRNVTQPGWVDDVTLFGRGNLDAFLDQHPKSEPAMMRALADAIPSQAMVFLGNSLPIREWNLSASVEPGHPLCFANRGANGIDGEVATFLGMSEGNAEAWGIFGDLTALYDLNAPAVLPQLDDCERRIVVMNNGGGRIFSRLPSMAGLSPEEKAVTENHHRQRFDSWASMWGMDYVSWRAGKPVPEISGKNVLIEVLLENGPTESFWKEMR